jgi:Bardet-Biedl syndrome 1 protein
MAHAGKLMTQSYSHDADPSGMTPNPDAPRVPKPKTTPKWLDAWSDPMAHVDATSELMDTADLAGDGEWRLVMCSRVERKIKVWANARLVSEQSLPDEPVAMRCFYALPTDGGARKPSVAVAAGSCVFIFRGNGGGGFENANRALRPHYKFTTPSLPVEPRETEVWRRLGDGADDAAVDDAVAELADARDAGAPLTERTLEFLAIGESFSENETNARDVRERRVRFARAHGASGPPIRRTSVTALAVIKHVADDVDATSRLVFCTEHGQVHVLSADAKEVQTTHQLPSAVAFVAVTTGSRAEGKHFIACACRDNRCYVVKDGALDDSLTIDLETPACGAVAVGGNTVVIGCVDDTAHAYALVDIDENGKAILAGQKLYTLYLPSSISAMTVLDVNRARRTERVAFSTRDGAIRVYHGAALVLALETDELDPCVGMRFGRFGREENALVTVAANGGVATRIMPRRADLTSGDAARDGGAAAAAAVPLAVPKKTKLYVEQTAREREFGRDMHVAFQKDLCRLRLNTARARVASMRDGGGRGAPRGGVGGVSVRLDASVRGLGPNFKVVVSAVNVGATPLLNASLLFVTEPRDAYETDGPGQKTFAALLPGVRRTCEVGVTCADAGAASGAANGVVRVYVCDPRHATPVVSAVVRMPVPEFLE